MHRSIPILMLFLLCSGCPEPDTSYDFDGDGWEDANDCNPDDPEIHPGADDPYGDGVDQDCDCSASSGAGDGIDRDCDGYPSNTDLPPIYEDLWDCDDDNAAVHPGAADVPGDGVDADCDGLDCSPDGIDDDGDGSCEGVDWGEGLACCDGAEPGDCDDTDPDLNIGDADNDGATTCDPDPDCDDTDAGSHPGADEICNLVDDDCDGVVDEGFDADADGVTTCGPDGDAGTADDDCDDGEALSFPGNPEVCDGVADNDCDGVDDPNEIDDDGDGHTECEGDCDDTDPWLAPEDLDQDGVTTCDGDCDDADPAAFPGNKEDPCDGSDNDCDGLYHPDEVDDDGDGATECAGDCDDTDPALHPFDGDKDGYTSCDGDCDDGNAALHPGQKEVTCDGLDNDCDGLLHPDEVDDDKDGWTECLGDCDDGDAFLTPHDGDADGLSTCDGDCDDGDATLNQLDDDGDGQTSCAGDCDDSDATRYSGAPEVPCDGTDNDCDGALHPWEADADKDGATICDGDCDDTDPWMNLIDADNDGYSPCDGDCDEGYAPHNPGAVEVVDGFDNDCDGLVDNDPVVCTMHVPGDNGDVEDTVAVAAAGATICVQPGTWQGHVVFNGNPDIQLLALEGPGLTTLEGTGGGVLTIQAGEDADTLVQGFTITGADASAGAAVHVDNASPTLRHLVVEDNPTTGIHLNQSQAVLEHITAARNDTIGIAGGLYLAFADVTITDLLVQENTAYYGGGGMYTVSSDALIQRARFLDNEANDFSMNGYGGGLAVGGSGTLTVDGAWFEGNSAQVEGGAVWADQLATPVLRNLVALDNDATHRGGGISLMAADAVVENVRLVGNVASAGGGIHVLGGSPVLDNLVVVGNTASGGTVECGGGIRLEGTLAEVSNFVVVGNDSNQNGGGLCLQPQVTAPQLFNGIVAWNDAAADGGGIWNAGSDPAMFNNLVWGNDPYDFFGMADPTGVEGNLWADPLLLQTVAEDPRDWDVHLATSSPAIDAGNVLFLDPDGGPADIGAYGGEGADDWDLDWDGALGWWRPGFYDPLTSPGEDCVDLIPTIYPGQGC